MASSHVAAPSARNPQPLQVPKELVAAVSVARPRCRFFQEFASGRCRKGAKCPFRHETKDRRFDAHLPHISRWESSSGVSGISLRPPVTVALELFLKEKKSGTTAANAQPLLGGELISFQLACMQEPDRDACVLSKRGWRKISTKLAGPQRIVHESSTKLPPYLMHATTIQNALSILALGEVNPSPGICGDGIYCFACKSPANDDIIEAWDRGIRGCYNGGAAILMESHGMLCRSCDGNDILCSGIIANRNDQYSAGPRTVSYMLAIFETDALSRQLLLG